MVGRQRVKYRCCQVMIVVYTVFNDFISQWAVGGRSRDITFVEKKLRSLMGCVTFEVRRKWASNHTN